MPSIKITIEADAEFAKRLLAYQSRPMRLEDIPPATNISPADVRNIRQSAQPAPRMS